MRTLLSTAMVGAQHARGRSGLALTGGVLTLTLVLGLGAPRARGQEPAATFPLAPVAESGVRGAATVAALGERASLVALAVVGLEPGASYRSALHAGACDHPGASVSDLAPLEADAAGAATAIVPVRVRGVEDIPLSVLTDGNHSIVVARVEAEPSSAVACGRIPAPAGTAIDIQSFIEKATRASCTDQRNQLFVIDDRMVVWIAKGNCPDGSYATRLFGRTPTELLCSLTDSIAGPMRTCVDDTVHLLFDTITANDRAPDLGLGPDHRVVLAWSASPSGD